ncbi:MAG: hypothetical protein AAB575_04690 [Patescibacteria group bacterium]
MASYTILREVSGVLVKVPKQGVNMKFVSAHEFTPEGATEPVKVPDHWKHGQIVDEECGRDPSEGKAIMNRHFYRLESGDFGHRTVATVRVSEKTCDDGRKFVFVDITKTKDVAPANEMSLVLGFPQVADDISVGKITVLRFTPYVKKLRSEALATDEPKAATA